MSSSSQAIFTSLPTAFQNHGKTVKNTISTKIISSHGQNKDDLKLSNQQNRKIKWRLKSTEKKGLQILVFQLQLDKEHPNFNLKAYYTVEALFACNCVLSVFLSPSAIRFHKKDCSAIEQQWWWQCSAGFCLVSCFGLVGWFGCFIIIIIVNNINIIILLLLCFLFSFFFANVINIKGTEKYGLDEAAEN